MKAVQLDAALAQEVERSRGKAEVAGSSPAGGISATLFDDVNTIGPDSTRVWPYFDRGSATNTPTS